MKKVKVFAPASVANVSCGFDILGFAVDGLGDSIEAEFNDNGKVEMLSINGHAHNLPLESEKNVCTVVAKAMLDNLGYQGGISFRLTKGVMPGSGLGSSASSSAVAAYAVNELFDKPYDLLQLVKFATIGEIVASGAPIADNVASSLFGGFVLIRSYTPLDIIALPVPEKLHCVLFHPQIEVLTGMARDILPKKVAMETLVRQTGNVAGLISGLYSNDYDLISRSLIDEIVEPVRSLLIPSFIEIKKAMAETGALGSGISGSGPTIFALARSKKSAKRIADSVYSVAKNKGFEFNIHVSKIAKKGARKVESEECKI